MTAFIFSKKDHFMKFLILLIFAALTAFASEQDRCSELYKGLSQYRHHIQRYLQKHNVDFYQVDNGFQIVPNSKTALNIYALKRKLVDRKDIWLVPIINRRKVHVDPFLGRLAFEKPALNILLDDVFRSGLNNANYHALKLLEE